ncbi:hypothetical protein DCD73_01215 [Mycobacteroides abscessus subsp. massiliense]|nr:hypothetical protein [Mycobacteroides abscessus]MDQ8117541.1 hypothetical protein [Mycobacteroides abscessus subsp. massiliense]
MASSRGLEGRSGEGNGRQCAVREELLERGQPADLVNVLCALVQDPAVGARAVHRQDVALAQCVPVSSEPPQSLDLLVDREYQRIAELLKPGRRATGEGMARIRSLLATEALADPDAAEISEADVRRVARGIREGKLREQVFPKLSGLTTDIQGAGLTVEVRMVKSDGLPVTYTNDPTVDSSAIRMIDLERKFHLGTYELADAADVSRSKAIALRRHLGLDADDGHYSHAFVFGRSKHLRYSDNAVRAMKKSLEVVDLGRVWDAHRTIAYNQLDNRPVCDQPGCKATS